MAFKSFKLNRSAVPVVPSGTRDVARDKRPMCCEQFAHNYVLATCWRQLAVQWGDCPKSRFVPFTIVIITIMKSSLCSCSGLGVVLTMHDCPMWQTLMWSSLGTCFRPHSSYDPWQWKHCSPSCNKRVYNHARHTHMHKHTHRHMHKHTCAQKHNMHTHTHVRAWKQARGRTHLPPPLPPPPHTHTRAHLHLHTW